MMLTGFVVAGGQSTRMGRDKSLLPYGDSTLLGEAIAKVRTLTPEVHILCGPRARYEDYGLPIVEDAICGAGPVGGLYSALICASSRGRERMLWLAVDVPLAPPELLERLVAELDTSEAAMARTERGIEPLCAAFRTEPTLHAVRRSVLRGQLKLTAALEDMTVGTAEADPAWFANINSPADFERLS